MAPGGNRGLEGESDGSSDGPLFACWCALTSIGVSGFVNGRVLNCKHWTTGVPCETRHAQLTLGAWLDAAQEHAAESASLHRIPGARHAPLRVLVTRQTERRTKPDGVHSVAEARPNRASKPLRRHLSRSNGGGLWFRRIAFPVVVSCSLMAILAGFPARARPTDYWGYRRYGAGGAPSPGFLASAWRSASHGMRPVPIAVGLAQPNKEHAEPCAHTRDHVRIQRPSSG